MPGNPDPSHTVPASMPAYAVRSFSWTAAVVVAAAVCLVLGWHEDQAWARMSAVTLVVVAAMTLGVTVLCLRQDAALRSIREVIENQAVLAYDMRRIVAYAERTLGASHDISEAIEVVRKHVDELPPAGDADQLKAISARLDELSRDFAQSQVARLHRPGRQRGESDYS